MKNTKQRKTSISTGIILGIVAMLLIFGIVVHIIGYHEFTRSNEENYEDTGFRAARAAASYVYPDHLDMYLETGGEVSEYRYTKKKLDELTVSQELMFINVFKVSSEDGYGSTEYIFDTVNPSIDMDEYPVGLVREVATEEYAEAYRNIMENGSKGEVVLRDRKNITTVPHLTVLIPLVGIRNDVRGILSVQQSMTILQRQRRRYLFAIIAAVAVFAALAVGLYTWYLHVKLLNPLRTIADEAERFTGDRKKPGTPLSDGFRSRDEIWQLADSIDRMETDIVGYIKNIAAVTREKERIGTELTIASRIQGGMLPGTFPAFPDRKEFDIFASMDPAKEVGGDFYDFFLIDEDHLALVIGDVSGKGIPASLFMMGTQILIKDRTIAGGTPAEILAFVNDRLCEHNPEEMFVTVWLGILEISTGVMTTANAGHEFPVISDGQGHYSIFKDKHGFVLGGLPHMRYKNETIRMPKGGMVLVYTDGVTEASDSGKRLFGEERLLKTLNEGAAQTPMQLIRNVGSALRDYCGEEPQYDDTTMLCVRYEGIGKDEREMNELTVEATPENFEKVREFVDERLKAMNCPERAQNHIDLAVEEIFVNVSSYAYDPETGPVTIRAEVTREPMQVKLTFIDHGMQYDPLAKADPDVTLPADKRRIGGLGIYLVKKMMDVVDYRYVNGQNILTIRKTVG